MKQVWITRAGLPEVLRMQDGPDPIPRTGEVRIRVEAIGINFADVVGRMGVYRDAPPLPYVPGYEVAGRIDMISQGVPDLLEGDRVLALTRFGGYSDVVCVPHKQVFKRLDWMSSQDGAAIGVNYLTAYMALIVMGALQPGNKVLVHGAAGGVGLAALDICRIIGVADVYGTASPHKHAFLRERGLPHPIDYRNMDYERVVMDLTGGKGVQLVLDPLGGAHWHKNYRLLSPTGRLVQYGASSLSPGKKRSWWHMLRGAAKLPFYSPLSLAADNRGVAGVNLGHLWDHADLLRPWMRQLIAWYDDALFRPHIDQTFPLAQAAAAHHYLHDRKNIGKVLLIP